MSHSDEEPPGCPACHKMNSGTSSTVSCMPRQQGRHQPYLCCAHAAPAMRLRSAMGSSATCPVCTCPNSIAAPALSTVLMLRPMRSSAPPRAPAPPAPPPPRLVRPGRPPGGMVARCTLQTVGRMATYVQKQQFGHPFKPPHIRATPCTVQQVPQQRLGSPCTTTKHHYKTLPQLTFSL